MGEGFKEASRSSWRDIQQANKGVKTTKVARKRHLVLLLRGGSVILLLLAIGAGIAGLRYFGILVEQVPEPPGSGPVQVAFQSNGFLTEAWFKQAFPEVLTADIRDVDVHLLKQQLEARGQIVAATVNVSLPSRLIVGLEERKPILRLRVQGENGQPRTLLVARDGTIYEGALYPAETLRRLPGVTGLRVRKEGDAYAPIRGLEPVSQLLDIAQAQLPALYRHWRVVDLSDWNPDIEYRPSLMKVSSTHIGEIVFSSVGIEEQIKRLAGILQHIQRQQLKQPKSIDLSFGEEAVIRYN